jgi:hypothetical protein
MNNETKIVKCECVFCCKEVKIEVYKIASSEDDCLGVVCKECEKESD